MGDYEQTGPTMGQGTSSFIVPVNSLEIISFHQTLHAELLERAHEVIFIPQNKVIARSIRGALPEDCVRYDYLSYDPQRSLAELCDKFEISSPRRLVFPEMVYDRMYGIDDCYLNFIRKTSPEYDRYFEILRRSLDYFDNIYSKEEKRIPLQHRGGEIIRRALQQVADHYNVPSVRVAYSPVPESMSLRGTEAMTWEPLANAHDHDMTSMERKQAAELRDSVVNDQTFISTDRSQDQESFTSNIQRKMRRVKQFGTDIGPVATDWLFRKGLQPIRGAIARRIYEGEEQSRKLVSSTDFVFYPIQYYVESRVTARAPAFYNQLWLIEYLSRSLPSEYELVVKDHPGQLGALTLSHSRTINRFATTVAPEIPAREIVQHADAVVTLNNTVGYEAILYGKPVLTLGDAFYSGCGYTYDITDMDNIHEALATAVNSQGLSEQEVLTFAHGILRSSYDGIERDDSPSNVEIFVDSVFQFLTDSYEGSKEPIN